MSKQKIIIASTNEGKLKEFKEFFKYQTNIDIELLKQSDEVEENGRSFHENAKIKAKHYAKKFNNKFAIIAEDSGLCIETLDGFPGIHSSRLSVECSTDYEDKNNYILQKIENKYNKRAYFYCSLVYIDTNNNMHTFKGTVDGLILKNTNNTENKGFGFDPIFYHEESNKFFSEMTSKEKNEISHRGIALKKLINFLESQK